MTTPRESGSIGPTIDRLAAQLRPAEQLDRDVEGVHVDVGDGAFPADGSPYTRSLGIGSRVSRGRSGAPLLPLERGERRGQEPRGDLAGDRPAQLRLPVPGGRGADEPVRGRAPRLGGDPRPAGRRRPGDRHRPLPDRLLARPDGEEIEEIEAIGTPVEVGRPRSSARSTGPPGLSTSPLTAAVLQKSSPRSSSDCWASMLSSVKLTGEDEHPHRDQDHAAERR